MRDQLTQYVNLLFAGNDDAEEIRLEILQNTLDRYDDLIAQGKSPDAAYRLAITGIGDINEILTGEPRVTDYEPAYQEAPVYASAEPAFAEPSLTVTRIIRAIAIGLYIISPLPVIALDSVGLDVLGVCGTLMIIAIATALILIFRKPNTENEPKEQKIIVRDKETKKSLKRSIEKIVSSVCTVLYFVISFSTGAWGITWVIFLMIPAINGLLSAIIDLREVN